MIYVFIHICVYSNTTDNDKQRHIQIIKQAYMHIKIRKIVKINNSFENFKI